MTVLPAARRADRIRLTGPAVTALCAGSLPALRACGLHAAGASWKPVSWA